MPAKTQRKTAAAAHMKEHLLETASRIMAERGYTATTIEVLCKEANVVPPTIYWHYGNKEGLLLAVVERAGLQWGAEFQAALHGKTIEEVLLAISALIARSIRNDPVIPRVLLRLGMERREANQPQAEFIKYMRDYGRFSLTATFGKFLRGTNPDETRIGCTKLADTVLSFMDGTFIAYGADPKGTNVEGQLALMRECVLSLAKSLFPASFAPALVVPEKKLAPSDKKGRARAAKQAAA
ncbi:MAG: TetR/AcrR family transcriptional regulator [Bdellovibrionota bacterium]